MVRNKNMNMPRKNERVQPIIVATLPHLSIMIASCLLCLPPMASADQVQGTLKQWHRITLAFDGPNCSESATPNPFTDFRLDVTLTGPSGRALTVPGYYAADGRAGQTGAEATSGDEWWHVDTVQQRPPLRPSIS